MGTEKKPAISTDTDSSFTTEDEVGGKLRLNKETLRDLSITNELADNVRGGAGATSRDGRCPGLGCTNQETGCN